MEKESEPTQEKENMVEEIMNTIAQLTKERNQYKKQLNGLQSKIKQHEMQMENASKKIDLLIKDVSHKIKHCKDTSKIKRLGNLNLKLLDINDTLKD